jgi:ketosteroid isomerase-like protein
MANKDQDDIIAMEKRFWQTLVDGSTDVAVGMLSEPALMVSQHGAMQFDHDGYRKMADNDEYKLLSYALSNMQVLRPTDDVAILTYEVDQTTKEKDREVRMRVSDSSTWVRRDGRWLCAIHTESPMTSPPAGNA